MGLRRDRAVLRAGAQVAGLRGRLEGPKADRTNKNSEESTPGCVTLVPVYDRMARCLPAALLVGARSRPRSRRTPPHVPFR
ncbi:hypothetical protein FRAHR75_40091 [Frankia sp. Hr75.2]|nr:hypothetical protein FRAHR75_40091 [Frankia sp. Hr75.2]